MFKNILDRISRLLSRFLSTKLVFLADLVLSVLVTALVFWGFDYFVDYDLGTLFTLRAVIFAALYSAAMFVVTGTYKIVIRYSEVRELSKFALAILGKTAAMGITYALMGSFTRIMWAILATDFLATLCVLVGIRVALIIVYDVFRLKYVERSNRMRILIFGTGNKAVATAARLMSSKQYRVEGFIERSESPSGKKTHGTPALLLQQTVSHRLFQKRKRHTGRALRA